MTAPHTPAPWYAPWRSAARSAEPGVDPADLGTAFGLDLSLQGAPAADRAASAQPVDAGWVQHPRADRRAAD